MKFEMIEKSERREVITRTNDIHDLIYALASKLANSPGSPSGPKLSGARGEIEIGIENGPQILIRVL